MAEQFVAQHLKYLPSNKSSPLLYWLKDKKQNKAEIDFLFQQSRHILPIEVKSGKSGSLKSLFYFIAQKKLKRAYRFDLQPRKQFQEKIQASLFDGEKTVLVKFDLYNYPIFLIEMIDNFSE